MSLVCVQGEPAAAAVAVKAMTGRLLRARLSACCVVSTFANDPGKQLFDCFRNRLRKVKCPIQCCRAGPGSEGELRWF